MFAVTSDGSLSHLIAHCNIRLFAVTSDVIAITSDVFAVTSDVFAVTSDC